MCTLEKRKSLSLNFKYLEKEKQAIARVSRRNNMQAEIHRIRSSTKKKNDETKSMFFEKLVKLTNMQQDWQRKKKK